MCFFFEPCPGAGLALEEELCTAFTGLFVAAGEAEMVPLVSESTRATETPPDFSLSELSSDDESELLEESELLDVEEGGSGVFLASFRAFLSVFLTLSSSESEESDEADSEESSELLELEESESEDDDSDESEPSLDEDSALETLAFLALGASSEESESEPEPESEDEELLDSAFRFTLVGFFAAGAGMGAASSSSSSSASLSELEEEEAEEEEGDDSRAALLSFLGASSILTSESLASLSELELEVLSLSELELDEALEAGSFSQDWKTSTRDGAFLTFVGVLPVLFRSFVKAALAPENPLSERNVETAARS